MNMNFKSLAMAKSDIDKQGDLMMKLSSAIEYVPTEPTEKTMDENPKAMADPSSFSLAQEFDAIVGDLDIPEFLKEHQTTLRFPEKLMLLLVEVERMTAKSGKSPQKACFAWRPEGLSFVIRHGDDLVGKILPMISCPAKFSSFLRKLYRWGFRQVVDRSSERSDKPPKTREKVFMHPYFQRDDKALMDRMKSITAEGTRKELATQSFIQNQESRLAKPVGNSVAPEGATSSDVRSSSVLHPFLQSAVPSLPQPQHRALAACLMADGAKGALGAQIAPKAFGLRLTPHYLTSSMPLGALSSSASLPLSINVLADQLVRDIRLRAAAADSLLLQNALTFHQRPPLTRSLFNRPSLNDFLPPLSNVLTTTQLGRLELLDSLVGGGDYRTH